MMADRRYLQVDEMTLCQHDKPSVQTISDSNTQESLIHFKLSVHVLLDRT